MMKNRNRFGSYFLILIIIGFFVFSYCSKPDNKELIEFKYGIFFGECVGYCKLELRLKSDTTIYTQSDRFGTLKPITCTQTTDKSYWDTLKRDFNIEKFMELPEYIGCPDCADGGAEWVEIVLTNGHKQKVTFEFLKEPDITKDIIAGLRDLLSQFENCSDLSGVVAL